MTSSYVNKNEEFYNKVRRRTADNWRKQYLTTEQEEEEAKEILRRLASKPESVYSISNVFWILTSLGILHLTDAVGVVMYDRRLDRRWLYTGGVCLSVAALCGLYCIVWLSLIKKIHSDKWEEHNIFVIPLATVLIIMGCVFTIMGLWPVWNIFTIPIVFIEIYGFVIFVAMIPSIF